MAKAVYKCDYCCDTYNTVEEAQEHEKECDYSPHNKKCGTCKYLVFEYGNDVCKLWGNQKTYEYWDDRLDCPFHENENKRENEQAKEPERKTDGTEGKE